MPRQFEYRWEWTFGAPPDRLWRLVADTNRFDRDAGVPAVTRLPAAASGASGADDGPRVLANGRTRVRVRQYGVALDYVEEPFEWDAPHRFAVSRRFETGPLGWLRIEAELTPTAEGGTHLTYVVKARARRAVFGVAIPIQVGIILARRFDRTFRAYDRIAQLGDFSFATGAKPRLAPGASERLTAQLAAVVAAGVDDALAARVGVLLREADDLAVARIRPYVLADEWGFARRDVLEAFLLATRAGLVELRWDVICPMCLGARASAEHLREMPTEVHCEMCNVDFGANFASSVELTFTPSPSIRRVGGDEFCIGNPMQTPHVVHQELLSGGEAMELRAPAEAGRYRLRCLGHTGSVHLRVDAGGEGDAMLGVASAGWTEREPEVLPHGIITVRNDLAEERLFILERTQLGDQAVTAAQVIALQRFRDLFADEVLRPSEQISVGTMAVVFTDLCDSTQLYQQIGDAVAFGRVLDHFDVLTRCVTESGGAVVKTIGDAVMAVFTQPGPALLAMLAARAEVEAQSAGFDQPLQLKIGMHFGPCLAVNLNDRLDYFGSTVNLAARLQGCASAGEIVISSVVHDDPDVQHLLSTTAGRLGVEQTVQALKGFEDDVTVHRLRPRTASAASARAGEATVEPVPHTAG